MTARPTDSEFAAYLGSLTKGPPPGVKPRPEVERFLERAPALELREERLPAAVVRPPRAPRAGLGLLVPVRRCQKCDAELVEAMASTGVLGLFDRRAGGGFVMVWSPRYLRAFMAEPGTLFGAERWGVHRC